MRGCVVTRERRAAGVLVTSSAPALSPNPRVTADPAPATRLSAHTHTGHCDTSAAYTAVNTALDNLSMRSGNIKIWGTDMT